MDADRRIDLERVTQGLRDLQRLVAHAQAIRTDYSQGRYRSALDALARLKRDTPALLASLADATEAAGLEPSTVKILLESAD